MEGVPQADDFSLEDLLSGLNEGESASTGLLTGEFGKQLGGSAVASIFTLLMIGLFVGLKKLCNRPSKCKSHLHCPCLDVDIVDRNGNTLRSAPESADGSGPSAV